MHARVKDGIIQTCSKCVSPHERREQNGIKLDQERVYFSKRKQDRGTEVSVTTPDTLLFFSSAPFAESLRGQSALLKLPFFLDPLFILPQWSSGSMANRFPQLHQSTLHTCQTAVTHTHTQRSRYNVRPFHIPRNNNHSAVRE